MSNHFIILFRGSDSVVYGLKPFENHWSMRRLFSSQRSNFSFKLWNSPPQSTFPHTRNYDSQLTSMAPWQSFWSINQSLLFSHPIHAWLLHIYSLKRLSLLNRFYTHSPPPQLGFLLQSSHSCSCRQLLLCCLCFLYQYWCSSGLCYATHPFSYQWFYFIINVIFISPRMNFPETCRFVFRGQRPMGFRKS